MDKLIFNHGQWAYRTLGIASLVTAGMLLCLSCSYSYADRIPPHAQPGAILQHQKQTILMQNQSPWLNRPITPQDQESVDADIEDDGPIVNDSMDDAPSDDDSEEVDE